MERDWKEAWIDEMGLIVALSGEDRFRRLSAFKARCLLLAPTYKAELSAALKQRFMPSSYPENPPADGCRSGMDAINAVTQHPSQS